VVDLLLEGPVELAFVGVEGKDDLLALRREVGLRYLPNRVVAHHDPSSGHAELPLLRGRPSSMGRPRSTCAGTMPAANP